MLSDGNVGDKGVDIIFGIFERLRLFSEQMFNDCFAFVDQTVNILVFGLFLAACFKFLDALQFLCEI